MQLWNHAIARILERMQDTRKRVGNNYPHWCDYETGKWTTTVDGDWTGGFWPGMHWLAAKYTGDHRYRAQALALTQGCRPTKTSSGRFKKWSDFKLQMYPPSARIGRSPVDHDIASFGIASIPEPYSSRNCSLPCSQATRPR